MTVLFLNHPEFKVLSVRNAWKDIVDEVKEFIQEPSKDELSDICFGIGRLLGAVMGKKYVRFPYDGDHIRKCNKRFLEYGHFRSRRHI